MSGGIDHIDLTREFVADRSATAAFERYYVRRDDGSMGHLSRAGHAAVAGLVVETLARRFNLRPEPNLTESELLIPTKQKELVDD